MRRAAPPQCGVLGTSTLRLCILHILDLSPGQSNQERGVHPSHSALQARVRHRQVLQGCRIERLSDGRIRVRFDEPQRALSPGQYCVLYEGERCLGGGEIDTTVTG